MERVFPCRLELFSAAIVALALLLSGCSEATPRSTWESPTPIPTAEVEDSVPVQPTPTPLSSVEQRDVVKCYFGPNESDWLSVQGERCPGQLSPTPKEWNPPPTSRGEPLSERSNSNPRFPSIPAEGNSGSDCTPGYDPCLPPASDYDCRKGSGNGPAYTDRVYVTGPDIYGLDADGDGIGCE